MDSTSTSSTSGQVFIRRSSGLTRQISAWDALIYCAVAPNLLGGMSLLMFFPYLFPGVNGAWAVLTVFFVFPVAGLYWFFSVSMPRSGGEYVYVSRILHPVLGLIVSFVISIVSISWFGTITDWWIMWGVGEMFHGLALTTGNTAWNAWADFFYQPWFRMLLGTCVIAFSGYIFMRGARWMMRLAWITIFVSFTTIIVLAIAVATGAHSFAANWTAATGIDPASIIKAAGDGGYLTKFTIGGTIMGGATYILLNTFGNTYSANLAGEVRGVQKTQLLSVFGSLVILMVIWGAYYQLFYTGFGGIFTNSLMYLWGSGNAAYPLAGAPMPSVLAGFLGNNPLWVIILSLGFSFSTFGAAAGLAFAPTRNIFAWAFDRMIPPKMAEINRRYKAPWLVILATVLAGEFFLWADIYWPALVSGLGYTIMAWFAAWIFVGIAGIIFPYVRKDIFDASPPMVRTRFAGVPVVTWLGLLTLIVSVVADYYMMIPVFNGTMPVLAIYLTASFFIIPLVIYIVSSLYYKGRGVSLAMQFNEVPPE